MNRMKYLTLLRFPNLLIIAITQYLVRTCLIIYPEAEHSLSNLDFFLLVISTVLIAGAGNAINDYFDVKVDQINRGEKRVVGTIISRKTAIFIHLFLSGIGLSIAAYLSVKLKIYWLFSFHLFAAVALWFYSTHFKKMFLIGNLLVSFLTGLVVLLVALFELVPLSGPVWDGESGDILKLTLAYAGFSFIISWIRETVKDLEDREGDGVMDFQTMAVIWPLNKTKGFVQSLSFLLFLGICFAGFAEFSNSWLALSYILVLVLLPLVLFILQVKKAKDKVQFHRASSLAKIIMLFGASSMLVFSLLSENGYL